MGNGGTLSAMSRPYEKVARAVSVRKEEGPWHVITGLTLAFAPEITMPVALDEHNDYLFRWEDGTWKVYRRPARTTQDTSTADS